ncbi:MAG: TIGR00296 family protein [Candidatus Thorarchaeota archaeon]|nr:TIGR00296 family protein [Candidatus Thorarchaeota archaeon]
MSHAYSDADGEFLVKLARKTVDSIVSSELTPAIPEDTPKNLLEKSGVFVTLNTLSNGKANLRGCIGRPYPTQSLVEATIDSAVDSAIHDPRFNMVEPDELDSIVIELSVLTPPKNLEYSNPQELLDLVKVGRDGLIVARGMYRGLLLPQVPVEWGWNTKEFVEHTCNKARLAANAWMDKDTEFMTFQAEIFGEKAPRGDIVRNPSHPRC